MSSQRRFLYQHAPKRAVDVVVAASGLVFLAPVLVAVMVTIRLTSSGPAIFRQDRIGRDGRVFTIYKFRTMHLGAEAAGVYSRRGDTRITDVGRFLRATSVDELPQLWNILRGDMSLVGPRPPLTYHPWAWPNYPKEAKRRFCVRPGITGWAQVNGRKSLSWPERIQLDAHYVDNVSWHLDLRILLLTLIRAFRSVDNVNTSQTA